MKTAGVEEFLFFLRSSFLRDRDCRKAKINYLPKGNTFSTLTYQTYTFSAQSVKGNVFLTSLGLPFFCGNMLNVNVYAHLPDNIA